jgi:mannuronan 5-epimerase
MTPVLIIFAAIFTVSLWSTPVLASIPNSPSSEIGSCIGYDSSERVISITCKTSTLTDIYNQINDTSILDKETSDGVWLLKAGIIIEHDAKLIIDEGDTKWLKILGGDTSSGDAGDGGSSDDDTDDDGGEEDGSVHAIRVHGSLNIDSVKITSWDPAINGYIKFESDILPGRGI